MPSWFPAARVRLIVRFDELGANDAPKPPERPPQLRTGKGRSDAKLAVVERDGRFLLLGDGDEVSDQSGGPQARITSADDRTHAVDLLPSRVTVSRNGIRTADTASATFRFADAPFDPRVLRAVAVQVFAGTLSQEDFSAGASGQKPDALLLPNSFVDGQGRARSNLRFAGWVDEWETDLGDGDEPLVSIECTDNTRLLIEQDAPPKLAIGADAPLDRALADYLSNFPQFRGLEVEYRPGGSEVPRLGAALAKTAFKPKLGPVPGGSGKLTVWDYVTDVCGAVGHVVRVEEATVVIQRARTLYGSLFPGRPDDPFRGRTLPDGRETTRRVFVYGRNVIRPRYRRRFSRYAPQSVEVRCWDPAGKKTLVARHPQKGDRPSRPLPGEASEQSWKVFPVTGVSDEATLRQIAQGVYEATSRNELEAEFETRDLASYGGGPDDPDALDVVAGDAFDLEIVRAGGSPETAAEAQGALRERPEAFLRGLGFPDGFARAYGRAAAGVGLSSLFRVRSATIEFSPDEGIVLGFVGVNYLEVRSDKELPAGEEPETLAGIGSSGETSGVGRRF